MEEGSLGKTTIWKGNLPSDLLCFETTQSYHIVLQVHYTE